MTHRPTNHRALVYVEDAWREMWGYWCMDCPQRVGELTTKQAAQDAAAEHEQLPVVDLLRYDELAHERAYETTLDEDERRGH